MAVGGHGHGSVAGLAFWRAGGIGRPLVLGPVGIPPMAEGQGHYSQLVHGDCERVELTRPEDGLHRSGGA